MPVATGLVAASPVCLAVSTALRLRHCSGWIRAAERRRQPIPADRLWDRELTSAFEDPWIEIRRFETSAGAREYALVLMAMGIAYRVVRQPSGIGLLVAAPEAARALHELSAYEEENRPRPAAPAHAPVKGLDGALVYGAALVFVYSAADQQAFSRDWEAAGAGQAGLIMSGEWWRVLTALGLHADVGHLIGNLIMGSLFGVFLAQILGAGLAWLAILLASAAGNALNALIEPVNHTSIGASTAVFAALGLLAALAWKREAAQHRRGRRKLLPLAAGVMLLTFLGVGGERTDIGAHVAGFIVGCVFGAGLYFIQRYLPHGRLAQYGFGAAALGLFAVAWVVALDAG